jgi:Cu+-exporting ATPase
MNLDLPIEGMTCASCAHRIERKLNKLDGVAASVNYATERATVAYDPALTSVDDLISTVAATGYKATRPSDAARADLDPLAALKLRVIVAAILSVPVLLLAMVSALQFDYWQWVSLALTTPVVFWAGAQFHRAAWVNLRHAAATMDTLISVGTIAAWAWSVVAMLMFGAGDARMRMHFDLSLEHGAGASEIYLEVAAVVITLVLLGRFFEQRAKRRAGSAVEALLELGAKEVALLDGDDSERRVPIEQLQLGDRFVVRPGEKIATDGVVVDGRSAVDQSIVTGESVPVDVEPGSKVIGATINAGGRIVVLATHIGSDTALSQIARLVTAAQSGKAPVQRLADRISGVFVPIVIALAVATLGFWLGAGAGAQQAFTAAVAVLIVACPCALGLATPTALLVGTGRGAQLGVLIKGPQVLESTRRVDTIVLDKTGTVTTGHMTLHDLVTSASTDRSEALRLVGSLEAASEHPIAQAIARTAHSEGELVAVSEFRNHEGLGVEGFVDGVRVIAGRPGLLAANGMNLPPVFEKAQLHAEAEGKTAIAAGWDGAAKAMFVVADTIKPTSHDAITQLRALDLTPVLLTGDNLGAARAVADQVGIDRVIADVMPSDKAEMVRNLQADGRVVAMVGDGVNDSPALAQADLGLAIGTGTDVAIEASDLTLVSGDLMGAVDAIRLSRRTLATIKGNLFWAFAYNVAALPLAASGYLNPLIAGAAMAFSSVFVVSNSLRLRRFSSARER